MHLTVKVSFRLDFTKTFFLSRWAMNWSMVNSMVSRCPQVTAGSAQIWNPAFLTFSQKKTSSPLYRPSWARPFEKNGVPIFLSTEVLISRHPAPHMSTSNGPPLGSHSMMCLNPARSLSLSSPMAYMTGLR